MGNAFLSHIQGVDGIFHVCRAFEDADVVHVEDRVDPVADLEIIHAELRAKVNPGVSWGLFGFGFIGRALEVKGLEVIKCGCVCTVCERKRVAYSTQGI